MSSDNHRYAIMTNNESLVCNHWDTSKTNAKDDVSQNIQKEIHCY